MVQKLLGTGEELRTRTARTRRKEQPKQPFHPALERPGIGGDLLGIVALQPPGEFSNRRTGIFYGIISPPARAGSGVEWHRANHPWKSILCIV